MGREIIFGAAKHVGVTMAAGLFILAMLSAADAFEIWLQARRER